MMFRHTLFRVGIVMKYLASSSTPGIELSNNMSAHMMTEELSVLMQIFENRSFCDIASESFISGLQIQRIHSEH